MAMNSVVGVWIDHREAVVVTVDEEETELIHVESRVEMSHRLSGGSRSKTPYGPQDIASEHRMEERRKHQLNRFFDGLMAHLRSPGQIFIMGPGEAKRKFVRYLQHDHGAGQRVAGVETRDKMPDNQIVEAVEEFFAHHLGN
jgi:stalled ribosome rescue protein Dom34